MLSSGSRRPYKLLIVEDDPATQVYLKALLGQRGLNCVVADNGETAVGILAASKIDLVITDLGMEGMDGHAMLDHLSDHHPLIPTLVLTGASTISEMLDCLRQGALAFVTKPLTDPAPLLEALDYAVTLLGHRRQQLRELLGQNRNSAGDD